MNLLQEFIKSFNRCSLTKDKKQYSPFILEMLNNVIFKLSNGELEPNPLKLFTIKDPVLREIFAPHFQDRVLQKFLVDKIEPQIDKRFIADNTSNRKNKGVSYAISRLKKFLKNKENKYYLQIDIKSFFYSIDQDTLYVFVKKHIVGLKGFSQKEKNLFLFLAKKYIIMDIKNNFYKKSSKESLKKIPISKSIFFKKQGKGLPIGSLTSQFFANIYLDVLDQYVKHILKIKYYIRYADDIIILHGQKQQNLFFKNKIQEYLKNKLYLDINLKKLKLLPVTNGINFLGYIIRPNYMLVRNRIIKSFKKRLYFFNHLFNPAKYPLFIIPENNTLATLYKNKVIKPPLYPNVFYLKSILNTLNTYFGIFNHANTFKLTWNLYHNHFHDLKKYFDCIGFNKRIIYIKPNIIYKITH
jgi:RNA-directed DNA polymerase